MPTMQDMIKAIQLCQAQLSEADERCTVASSHLESAQDKLKDARDALFKEHLSGKSDARAVHRQRLRDEIAKLEASEKRQRRNDRGAKNRLKARKIMLRRKERDLERQLVLMRR
ncbi:MAG: hypothetical protein Q9227_007321 [Pyrenula ochraceoflavens]